MPKEAREEFELLIRSRYGLILLDTVEDDRAESMLKDIASFVLRQTESYCDAFCVTPATEEDRPGGHDLFLPTLSDGGAQAARGRGGVPQSDSEWRRLSLQSRASGRGTYAGERSPEARMASAPGHAKILTNVDGCGLPEESLSAERQRLSCERG